MVNRMGPSNEMDGVLYRRRNADREPRGYVGDVSGRPSASVDFVAAEDTRRTGRLLQSFGVEHAVVSLFDGNEKARTGELLRDLRAGAFASRSFPTGGCRSSPIPGTAWSGLHRGGDRCPRDPGTVGGHRRPRGQRPPDRPVHLRGLPARRSRASGCATSRRSSTIHAPSSSSSHRFGSTDPPARLADGLRRPQGRALPGAHEAPRGGRCGAGSPRRSPSSARASSKGEVVVVLEGERERPVAAPRSGRRRGPRARGDGMRKREAARAVAERHGISANDVYRVLVSDP